MSHRTEGEAPGAEIIMQPMLRLGSMKLEIDVGPPASSSTVVGVCPIVAGGAVAGAVAGAAVVTGTVVVDWIVDEAMAAVDDVELATPPPG